MQIEHTVFQDQLVRGLAHRMNNILTLFNGYVGILLENQRLDRETRDGLAKIKDGARAASELMDRTYSLVRPSSVIWREIRLHDFLHLLRPSFEALCEPETKLTVDCADDLPTLSADGTRLRSAIFELVRNAIEAAGPAGHVQIAVSATTTPPGTSARQSIQWICIGVRDDGPGIPEEIRDRIYEPFFSTKKKQNAAGLGLSVAAGFVQQMGGVLRSETGPGATTFQMLLPSRTDSAT